MQALDATPIEEEGQINSDISIYGDFKYPEEIVNIEQNATRALMEVIGDIGIKFGTTTLISMRTTISDLLDNSSLENASNTVFHEGMIIGVPNDIFNQIAEEDSGIDFLFLANEAFSDYLQHNDTLVIDSPVFGKSGSLFQEISNYGTISPEDGLILLDELTFFDRAPVIVLAKMDALVETAEYFLSNRTISDSLLKFLIMVDFDFSGVGVLKYREVRDLLQRRSGRLGVLLDRYLGSDRNILFRLFLAEDKDNEIDGILFIAELNLIIYLVNLFLLVGVINAMFVQQVRDYRRRVAETAKLLGLEPALIRRSNYFELLVITIGHIAGFIFAFALTSGSIFEYNEMVLILEFNLLTLALEFIFTVSSWSHVRAPLFFYLIGLFAIVLSGIFVMNGFFMIVVDSDYFLFLLVLIVFLITMHLCVSKLSFIIPKPPAKSLNFAIFIFRHLRRLSVVNLIFLSIIVVSAIYPLTVVETTSSKVNQEIESTYPTDFLVEIPVVRNATVLEEIEREFAKDYEIEVIEAHDFEFLYKSSLSRLRFFYYHSFQLLAPGNSMSSKQDLILDKFTSDYYGFISGDSISGFINGQPIVFTIDQLTKSKTGIINAYRGLKEGDFVVHTGDRGLIGAIEGNETFSAFLYLNSQFNAKATLLSINSSLTQYGISTYLIHSKDDVISANKLLIYLSEVSRFQYVSFVIMLLIFLVIYGNVLFSHIFNQLKDIFYYIGYKSRDLSFGLLIYYSVEVIIINLSMMGFRLFFPDAMAFNLVFRNPLALVIYALLLLKGGGFAFLGLKKRQIG